MPPCEAFDQCVAEQLEPECTDDIGGVIMLVVGTLVLLLAIFLGGMVGGLRSDTLQLRVAVTVGETAISLASPLHPY